MTLHELKKSAKNLEKPHVPEYDVDMSLNEAGTQLDYLLAAHQMLDQVEGRDTRRIQELLLVKIREKEQRVERQECPECEGEGGVVRENSYGDQVGCTCRECYGTGRVFIDKENTDE